jgi:hypothetical protein
MIPLHLTMERKYVVVRIVVVRNALVENVSVQQR